MFELAPIGHIRNVRRDPGDEGWAGEECQLELAPEFDVEALRGIEEFSHVEVVLLFHLVLESEVERGSRHPQGNPAFPRVGIFAQRAKDRPNRLGVTIASLVSRQGRVLTLRGLDAIDGSPVLDLKPVMEEFLPLRYRVDQPEWSREYMKRYWWTSMPAAAPKPATRKPTSPSHLFMAVLTLAMGLLEVLGARKASLHHSYMHGGKYPDYSPNVGYAAGFSFTVCGTVLVIRWVQLVRRESTKPPDKSA